MSKKLLIYVSIVIVLGLAFFILTFDRSADMDVVGVVTFIVLSIIAESLLIITPGHRGLSVGFAVNLAAILVLGVPEAAWVGSLGVMLRVFKNHGARVHIFNAPLYKTLFNAANIALSAGMGGYAYQRLGGIPGVIDLNDFFIPLIISIFVYILVNATIISILMHILTEETFTDVWFKNIIWVIKDYFAMAPLAVIMAIAYVNYNLIGVLLFFVPLLFARYSFKLYLDMKNMYLETVKSLSQAIEAKDPYTNGHSLRVSEYACKLAERLGLSDKRIENLRIAAILHDIGKIGVEEHILNKPGRLTEAEYEKIKQHPAIGVRIIREIDFLSEASKIILSHHERYDGKGYPEGRRAGEINLEASILSIADVFDALTSERPYRNAMSVQEALKIIEEGRGTQFDFRIADTFVKMIRESKELRRIC